MSIESRTVRVTLATMAAGRGLQPGDNPTAGPPQTALDYHRPMPDPSDRPADGSTIIASGTGRVALAPDLAELRLGVAVSRPTVDAARSEAARLMDAILAAVDVAGVERRDVRTALLSVQPRYDYRDGKPPTLTGYELSNVVEVTIRDLGRLGDVVDGTLGAGATSMDSLSFRLADPTEAEREARTMAMAQARSRAETLAEAAGLAIEGVTEVVEGAAVQPPGPRAKAERMLMAADASTPVEAGSLEVSVAVTVTYRAR